LKSIRAFITFNRSNPMIPSLLIVNEAITNLRGHCWPPIQNSKIFDPLVYSNSPVTPFTMCRISSTCPFEE
jgi:hypothetical protein